ncbi:peptide/nickel transport system ATP-binding protein [Bacillus oleivorans]|uniref:Peptide/nickel transport system ATP-binding protein n=1 Tax=Bacillus oleivorans TaxID=1448271 RepID=A0A285D4G3_9BACI|nr:ABC transporter ATP-binding protein [Bacillus oleivorans]SNX74692.1 peptide/nickel transport system ATP-binding protein [Bacillus oleivorans]
MTAPLLSVENLEVSLELIDGHFKALEDISFSVLSGEVVGIVGESGCGKSLTSQAIMGILPKNASVQKGRIWFKNKNLAEYDEKQWQGTRGKSISMIFQEPMTSLNPLMTIGNQIGEVLKRHTNFSKAEIKNRTIALMKEIGLPDPEKIHRAYPHQLSGGMRQRIIIAIALIAEPDLIIADEPTTALDVTIQAQILELFQKIKHSRATSMIFISHDLGVIKHICDRVLVMYAGRIVEEGPATEILKHPKHPYTKGLIQSIPDHKKSGQVLYTIPGKVPMLKERNTGCPFADRCPHVMDICYTDFPEENRSDNQSVFCHLYSKVGEVVS